MSVWSKEHEYFNEKHDLKVVGARKRLGLPSFRNIHLPNHPLMGQTFSGRIVEGVNIQFSGGSYRLAVMFRRLDTTSHGVRNLKPFRHRFINEASLIAEGMKRGTIQELLKSDEVGGYIDL